MQTRSPYDTECRLRRADGTYRHFAARGVPVLEPDGRIREWVGTCTDITERKRAEDLARHREHLEELVRERTKELEGARGGPEPDAGRQPATAAGGADGRPTRRVREIRAAARRVGAGLQKAGEELSACNTIEDRGVWPPKRPWRIWRLQAWVSSRPGKGPHGAARLQFSRLQCDAETYECVPCGSRQRPKTDRALTPSARRLRHLRQAVETGHFPQLRHVADWAGGQCVATLTIQCPEAGADLACGRRGSSHRGVLPPGRLRLGTAGKRRHRSGG